MDSRPIAEVNQALSQFVHSADAYDNRLKLVFVLMNILRETSLMLLTIDADEFISEVRQRIDELEKQVDPLAETYQMQLFQNNEVIKILGDKSSNQIVDIQRQVDSLLKEYDAIIKALVEIRDRLPIERQIEIEKNNR